jgi:hypothetical protein
MKEFLVAVWSMQEASSISAMKVEIPLNYWSEAPTLAIMLSMIGSSALLAGTKQPMCIKRRAVATCLMNVLLPPMFGPVMIYILLWSLTIKQSFEMH